MEKSNNLTLLLLFFRISLSLTLGKLAKKNNQSVRLQTEAAPSSTAIINARFFFLFIPVISSKDLQHIDYKIFHQV